MRTIQSCKIAFVGAAMAALLSACGSKEQTSAPRPADNIPLPSPPLVASCEPGIPGGRLVVATFGNPKTFNPVTAAEHSSIEILQYLFASLLTMDWPTQDMLPGLAESWSMAPDQKTWTFKLRHGLLWSDGQPLTADDVVFTWEVIYNPDIINVLVDQFRINGKDFQVTKIDDYTVRVVTPEIYAPFLEAFGSVPVVPKHKLFQAVAEKRFGAAYGVDAKPEDLVGSGPFRIKQFKPDQFSLLERNPYFLEVDKQRQRLPYFENFVYSVVPDQNAVSLRFLHGESDVNERVRPDEYDRYKEESSKGRFKLLDLGIGPETAFFWFNENTGTNSTGKPCVDSKKLKWFRNQKFRQAVSYAVDRESIVKAVYAGRAVPNYGPITAANPKWQNTNVMQYPYNLEKARALLADIGIKERDADGFLKDAEGNTVEFVLNTNTGNDIRGKTAVLIQEDLKTLGFKVTFQPVEFNTLVQKIDFSFDYDCVLMGLAGGGVDPVANMNVFKSSGFEHQWFPREKSPSTDWEAHIDMLMDEQLKTLDYATRKKEFDEVQAILAEQVPMIYTVAPKSYAGVRSDIGNTRPTVLSYYRVTWNAEELYFKK